MHSDLRRYYLRTETDGLTRMATLLIVDDEYVITEILECIFEDEGYTVVKTVSAVNALKVLDRVRPDLVIADFMMPVMNGVELATAIRAHPVFHQLPIVLMTGGAADQAQATSGLFTEIVTKPFEVKALIRTIQSLM